jgi:hypothetical protein
VSEAPGSGAQDDAREPDSPLADPPTLDLGAPVAPRGFIGRRRATAAEPELQTDAEPDTDPNLKTALASAPAAGENGRVADSAPAPTDPFGAPSLWDRPEVTLGAAFACGLLLRALIRRRRRS